MKYKVGDKVRIKDDISECEYRASSGAMDKWQGEVMTIRYIDANYYKMEEDKSESVRLNPEPGWEWYEDMIERLVVNKSSYEILNDAIAVFGKDHQVRMIQEEMSELGVALSKYHRYPCEKKERDVQEEIADVCIMMQQAKIMFGKKEIDKIINEKIIRLEQTTEDERAVQVVCGKHEAHGKIYTWINPKGYPIGIDRIVMADTKYGEVPIIVTDLKHAKFKDVKHYKHITGGVK